jgi:hypothetical protein
MSFAIGKLVACWSIVQATQVRFLLILSFFKFRVCNDFGGHYFNLIFLVCALFFFSFFIVSHSRMREGQLVSQRERLIIPQHLATVMVYTLLK